jgi:hypothetical protein
MKNEILCALLFLSLGLQSQNAYYDAMTISKFVEGGKLSLDSNAIKVYGPILNSYLKEPTQETNYMTLLEAFFSETSEDHNPILSTFFDPDRGGGASASSVSGSLVRSAISSVGNLNVTNFADGLAKFLVARAKEELNVAFFTKLQDFLKEYPEIKVVFPHTYDFLDQIYAYQYAAMLPALRAGFQLDMDDFSDNLIQIREMTHDHCEDVTTSNCAQRVEAIITFLNEELAGRSIVAALLASNSIMKGVNAAEILDEIALDKIIVEHDDNLSNCIHFANLLSGSLRSANLDAIWVNKTELKALTSNRDAFRIYLGLLYALDGLDTKPLAFVHSENNAITLKSLLVKADTIEKDFNVMKQSISAFGTAADEVSSLAKHIVRAEEGSQYSPIVAYADYAGAISDLLKQGVTFFESSLPQVSNDVKSFTTVIDIAVDACYDIKSHNYGSLVLHTSQIMELILDEKYTYKDEFIKYGSFMAGIVGAETSDEVKAAIEAAVLPVGSASIKRETVSNISLNAFIGPMVGMEYLGGLTEDQWAPIVGVTAPLGVAFSWGRLANGSRKHDTDDNKYRKGGKSLTLFVPLIDVGSIATFRLGDETSNVAAEIKLENIIAPGVYGYWGFGKVPVSIGLGGQIGPQLRQINATDINIDQNFYLRFGLNVVVDIPFFNLYTRN